MLQNLFAFFLGDEAGVDDNDEFHEVEETIQMVVSMTKSKVRTLGIPYIITTETAKSDFACSQYPIFDLCAATLQFFVIYQGGPGWGCFGSDISLPA